MTTKEILEEGATQIASFLEKSTEIKLFLHLACFVFYVEIALGFLLKKPMLQLNWKDLELITPGAIVASILLYFGLMGYAFRLLYTLFVPIFFSKICFALHSSSSTKWGKSVGMVHKQDVLKKAYESKDDELTRMLEAHQQNCQSDRKDLRQLSYLAFAGLAMTGFNYLFVANGVLSEAMAFIGKIVGHEGIGVLVAILILPLLALIYFDASDDHSRDEYLNHEPLYWELYNEKEKKKNSVGA